MPQDISFLDVEIKKNPHAAQHKLRQAGPLYFDKTCGMYMVLGYNEVRDILSDPQTFSSVTGLLLVKQSDTQEKINAVFEEHGFLPINTLVVADPPEHTYHRSLLNKAFNATAFKRMESFVDETVTRLVRDFVTKGGGNFYKEIAAPLPSFVVADMLGLDISDMAKFRTWTDAVVSEANPDNSDERQIEITRTICELQQYVSRKADEYIAQPKPCVLSDIVNAEVDGRRLSRRELVSIFTILIAGSHDTTTSALCSVMYRLATDHQLQDRIRSNPPIIKGFVEEALRIDSPVAGLFRRATRDTEVAGVSIPEGTLLMLRYGAANRDPAMFPDPDTFDPERNNAARHLAFGYGIHHCLGNVLARAEIRLVTTRLLEATRTIGLSGGEQDVGWLTDFIVYGPNDLSLTVEAA